jgi:hypothetical protein
LQAIRLEKFFITSPDAQNTVYNYSIKEGIMNEKLSNVLQHPHLWRGSERTRPVSNSVPSGSPELDALLPEGGWPRGALTELFIERQGIGELRLLMPALARLSRERRWLAWIAPPHVPYAPALAAHGIELSRVLVVRPRAPTDHLWALEQGLRSNGCSAVLGWPGALDDRRLRRLQLAAEAGNTVGLLFRHRRDADRPSPAALRLRLEADGDRIRLNIFKRRGAAAATPIKLDPNDALAGHTPGEAIP